jgi:hypothetical protein
LTKAEILDIENGQNRIVLDSGCKPFAQERKRFAMCSKEVMVQPEFAPLLIDEHYETNQILAG